MTLSHTGRIILFAIGMKVLYILFALLLESFSAGFTFPHDGGGLMGLFKRNDSYWYEQIHDKGYPPVRSSQDLGWHDKGKYHQSAWGFLPGYPLAVKALSTPANLGFDQAAFVLSTLLSIACFLLFYRLACAWSGSEKEALFSTLAFMAMPFHYFYSMMYSESLYGFLLMGAFLAAMKRQYFLMAVMAGWLVLVKAGGLVMMLPLAVFILEGRSALAGLQIRPAAWPQALKPLWWLAVPLVVVAALIVYQFLETSDPFAYATAQKGGCYRRMMFPLAGLFRSGDTASQFNSLYAVLFIGLAVLAWKKLPASYNLVIWLAILLPISAGSSIGLPRYYSAIFPLFFVTGQWLSGIRHEAVVISILVVLQLISFYFWLVSHPLSY